MKNSIPSNSFTVEQKIQVLRTMLCVRQFEQEAFRLYNRGTMGGWLILQIGQESISTISRLLMQSSDHSICNHRSLGHALSSGMSMNECMAELMGKASGCSKGKGGMLGIFSPENKFWGGHGIAGTQTALGNGFAFAQKYNSTNGITVCFLGEGATNQGIFHESLNLASIAELPIVYIIENNKYAMWMSIERSSAYPECLAQRAEAYNIFWDITNSWEIDDLHQKLEHAFSYSRTNSKPYILEIQTYRFFGFSVADASHKLCRTVEEIEFHKTHRDPIKILQNQLLQAGAIDQNGIEKLAKDAKEEAKLATKFALASDPPKQQDIFGDVYWEVDNQTEHLHGTHFFNDDINFNE